MKLLAATESVAILQQTITNLRSGTFDGLDMIIG